MSRNVFESLGVTGQYDEESEISEESDLSDGEENYMPNLESSNSSTQFSSSSC